MAGDQDGDNHLKDAIERSFTEQASLRTLASIEERITARWAAHEREHEQMDIGIKTAIAAVDRERVLHVTAHEAAHVAHQREHALDDRATAVASESHSVAHELEKQARDKAEQGIDKRLEGMNEVRAQLKDQASTFARVEVLNALTDRVIAIEKLDIKGEGRSLGQGAVIAAIVGATTFAATVLGLIIIISNLLTAPT